MNHHKLFIKGDIESGWVRLIFSWSNEEFVIFSSYIFDGLANLISAAITINKGFDQSEASFFCEPEEFIFSFSKLDAETIELTCFCRDKFKGDSILFSKPSDLKVVFRTSTTIKRLTNQVLSLFDYFEKTYGHQGYEERWRRTFPAESLDKLRNIGKKKSV